MSVFYSNRILLGVLLQYRHLGVFIEILEAAFSAILRDRTDFKDSILSSNWRDYCIHIS